MKKLSQILSVALIVALGCSASFGATAKDQNDLTIKWFGHASFGIATESGTQIVTDPYDEVIGYKFPKVSTNILTVSHDHFDHNNIKILEKYSHLVEGVEIFKHDGIEVKGIASVHDEKQGSLRGKNTIYVYTINQMRICHLGDQGVELTKDQLKAIGKVDVLMIPVGGLYTIDAKTAAKVVTQVNPKVVLPMHYKTDALIADFGEVTKVEAFTDAMKGWTIEQADTLTLNKANLDKSKGKKIVVLSYNK